MYLDFFGLKEYPFRLTPDTDFLFMSSGHARAKAYMDYSVWNREGFIVITGDIGCGKTTLIQKLISELSDENVLVAKIFQTQLDEVEFLQAVLVEFGLNPFNAKKVELMDMLNTFLIEAFQNMRQVVLIVDEAHNLSMKVLEEIRLLSGLETRKEKILHVMMVGQPQLNEILESPELEQLMQRIRLRFHLKPLSVEETAEYIGHRLRVAGATRDNIFDPDTIPVIYKYAGGVPRLINTLCDTALTCAYADTAPKVSLKTLQDAVEELQWLPFAKRVSDKRLRDRASRSPRARAAGPTEQGQWLETIGSKLSQLDTVAAALGAMVKKMDSIDSKLQRIADGLSPRSNEPKVVTPRQTGRK